MVNEIININNTNRNNINNKIEHLNIKLKENEINTN